MNREQMKSFGEDPAWAEMAEDTDLSADEFEAERNEFLEQDLGTPAAEITHAVDVTGVVVEKKAAMAAHVSDHRGLHLPRVARRRFRHGLRAGVVRALRLVAAG